MLIELAATEFNVSDKSRVTLREWNEEVMLIKEWDQKGRWRQQTQSAGGKRTKGRFSESLFEREA